MQSSAALEKDVQLISPPLPLFISHPNSPFFSDVTGCWDAGDKLGPWPPLLDPMATFVDLVSLLHRRLWQLGLSPMRVCGEASKDGRRHSARGPVDCPKRVFLL